MKDIKVDLSAGTSIPDYYADQAVGIAAMAAEPLPENLADWFGRLRLLYGVPFEYLVPEERLLPRESIRFFYVDQNWLDRLVDGAITIGKVGTRDYYQYQKRVDAVRESLALSDATVRTKLRGEEVDPKKIKVGGTVSGVLIRSSIVIDYPGLEIRAYDKVRTFGDPDYNGRKLPLLRMDRLAPDILFCLFQGVPKHLEVEEPREGIQFGVEASSESSAAIYRRKSDGSYDFINEDDRQEIEVPFRNNHDADGKNLRVIDVKTFAANIGTADSSEVARQCLQFPYLQYFSGAGNCVERYTMTAVPFTATMNFQLLAVGDQDSSVDIPTVIEANLEEIVGQANSNIILNRD